MSLPGHNKTVVVGMSGGVDSSVAALLLKQQGYNVIGMFMKNWDEKDEQGVCTSAEDYNDAVQVCHAIGIPYYSVSFVKEYWDNVFTHFLKDYEAGMTPNPDILCNREIKFKALLEKALELGADYLATGHYCRTDSVDGESRLLKGLDPEKDQSYFLYAVSHDALTKALFPIGHLEKKEVREIAKAHGLPTAAKKDSTGICFIGERNFKKFLSQYIPNKKGNFENTQKQIIGTHDGMAYYTIGQRRGLAIGGPGDAWFVVGKDPERNVVIVEQGADHPSLYEQRLFAHDLHWISPKGLPAEPFRCAAKIRYRQEEQPCVVTKITATEVAVIFDEPQRAVTPRQSIVFYEGDVCLGGGLIS